jgi:hypothetical protein
VPEDSVAIRVWHRSPQDGNSHLMEHVHVPLYSDNVVIIYEHTMYTCIYMSVHAHISICICLH